MDKVGLESPTAIYGRTVRMIQDPVHRNLSFGTPCFPSPLDRIRSGHAERRNQFGLNTVMSESFEGNQSFPKVNKVQSNVPASYKVNLDNFKGGGLNDVSFTSGLPQLARHSSGKCSSHSLLHNSSGASSQRSSNNTSLNNTGGLLNGSLNNTDGSQGVNVPSPNRSVSESWSFYNHIGGGQESVVYPSTVRNPNKALCTIDAKTSEILTANEMACELFSYDDAELIGKPLKDLVRLKPKHQVTILESHLESSGEVVNINGKIVEVVDKCGLTLPVSIWVKRLEECTEPRCLVVMEPVERSVANVYFSDQGTILSCDDQLAFIHGYTDVVELCGVPLTDLIPALKLPNGNTSLPKNIRKQQATGRSKDGASFPLCVAIETTDLTWEELTQDNPELDVDCSYTGLIYRGVVWVFANISGLVTFLSDGTIHSINDNFSLMLLGYRSSELINESMCVLMPDFYEILDLEDGSDDSGARMNESLNKYDCEKQGVCRGFELGSPGVTSTPNKSWPSAHTDIKRLSVDPADRLKTSISNQGDLAPVSKPAPSTVPNVHNCGDNTPSNKQAADNAVTDNSDNQPEVRSDTDPVPLDNHAKANIVEYSDNKNGLHSKQEEKVDQGMAIIDNSPVDSSPTVESPRYATVSQWNNTRNVNTWTSTPLRDAGVVPRKSAEFARQSEECGVQPEQNVEQRTEDSGSGDKEVSPVPHSVVCTFNSTTGQMEVVTKFLPEQENIGDKVNSHGCSTPVKKYFGHLNLNNEVASPCLSDIVALDNQDDLIEECEHRMEKMGIRNDDDRVAIQNKLNTTDELLLASPDIDSLSPVGKESCKNVEKKPSAKSQKSSTGSGKGLREKILSEKVQQLTDTPKSSRGFGTNLVPNPRVSDQNGLSNNDTSDKSGFNSSSDKENHSYKSDASSSDQMNSGFISRLTSESGGSAKSSIGVIDDIEESILHKSSINQFLTSRLSKSQNGHLDNSKSFSNSPVGNSKSYLIHTGLDYTSSYCPTDNETSNINDAENANDLNNDIVVYHPALPVTPDNERADNESADNKRSSNMDNDSDLDNSGYDYVNSPSLTSFERHEKGVRYIARSGSKYSDYSSTGTVVFPEGSFQGQCQHKDQTLLSVVFQIKHVVLDDSTDVYCMWISRDPEDAVEMGRSYANLTLASSLNSTMDHSQNFSLGEALTHRAQSASKYDLEESCDSLPELSNNFSNKSHDHTDRSHDITGQSHDSSRLAHDHSHNLSSWSHDQSVRSHDYSRRSHDHSRRSHDQSIRSHDLSARSHDQSTKSHDRSLKSHDHESPHVEPEEVRATKYGPYARFYNSLHTIGKGAFGFVKIAERATDREKVVVKFIRQEKVFADSWVEDDIYGKIPVEVSVLYKLSHPNIVKVLDVFSNKEFIQLVMEKHGSGMDLFEFIDRAPNLDEPLASYMFRQMVSAVAYLHSKMILHRDIKDENIIVNETFQLKLIDFGAVAFLQPGQLFSTFCGTLEYCSPEVLMGNKYEGPELEVWSLGVTLYTLVFGENPFFDVEETIKCTLKPPFPVSSSLMMLLCWMLHPDPKCRPKVTSLETNAWVKQKVNMDRYSWADVLPNCEFHGNTASDNRPDSVSKVYPPAPAGAASKRSNGLDDLKCNLMNQLDQLHL